jgi:hypothetical protein
MLHIGASHSGRRLLFPLLVVFLTTSLSLDIQAHTGKKTLNQSTY